MSFWYLHSSILPKFDFTTMLPQVKLFSLVFWENWRHQKYILKLTDLYWDAYYLFDAKFKGIFTGPPPDFKPARNKKYPYYTPLRNANIFSDRQHLSFERKRVIVAVEKRKKAHALLMRQSTFAGVTRKQSAVKPVPYKKQRSSAILLFGFQCLW